ncbi:MAG: hypothetical protein BAJATHORv1_40236 [Candidatus Thorarchaeota archaeon]|nr:MAG: hypothetical protein BAJATHORv1_40236 [Candidatus Thorarchaeota archaeon]
MADKKTDEEVAESQKLTPKDKQELQEGACVNCVLLSIIFTFAMMIAVAL